MNFFVQVTEGETFPQYPNLGEISLEQSDEKGPLKYQNKVLSFDFEEINISFDFIKYFEYWHKSKPIKAKDLLGRALGLKTGESLLDFSCGTGKDASLFLYWGLEVIAFERNPMVYLLLTDALYRLANHDHYKKYLINFSLIFGDSAQKIHDYPNYSIYYDPMFGSSKKKDKAKSRKEMEFFKNYIGEDLDGYELLKTILDLKRRVILKRPDNADELENLPNCLKWKGKTVEYWRFN